MSERISDAELADCIEVARQEAESFAAHGHGRTRIKADTLAALRELERLRKLEQRALIWSAYQDDDSKRDQQTDPQLAHQADEAERSLFEALI